jgi:hypothetical protein
VNESFFSAPQLERDSLGGTARMHVDRGRFLKAALRDTIVVLIGVPVVIASVILYAKTEPHPWMPSRRWWDLAAITGALVWVATRAYRRYWRQPSFWLTIVAITAVHLAVWSIVLTNVAEWPSGWGFLGLTVEAPLFLLALRKLGYDWAD